MHFSKLSEASFVTETLRCVQRQALLSIAMTVPEAVGVQGVALNGNAPRTPHWRSPPLHPPPPPPLLTPTATGIAVAMLSGALPWQHRQS